MVHSAELPLHHRDPFDRVLVAAANAATGELLLFLDDDCLPKDRKFVAALVHALRWSGVAGLSLSARLSISPLACAMWSRSKRAFVRWRAA